MRADIERADAAQYSTTSSWIITSEAISKIEKLVSNAHGKQFTTGFKKEVYSPLAMQARIT